MPKPSAQHPGIAASEPSSPYVLVNARHGLMLVNVHDIYIGQAIIQYGEYGELEATFLTQLIRRPGVVIEVGANNGSLTVPMSKRAANVGAELVVFEPQPFVFQNLCANLALNGISNVRAWPWACGAEAGSVYFPRQNYQVAGNFGSVSMHADAAPDLISVPCVRLDDIVGNADVSLVKLDIEGFELQALKGATRTLQRSRPFLYLENDRIDKSRELIEWLWEQQYRLWWHVCLLFNPHNFRGKSENVYSNTASINMFAAPREANIVVRNCREVVDAESHPILDK